MKPAVIYISYDGMLEPLGQSQVISYLEKLSSDYSIRLISFEKKEDRINADRIKVVQQRLDKASIKWTPLKYHKRPSALATAWDILIGMIVVLWFSLMGKVSILHVRSYVPALMALPAKRISRAKLLFDIRGFWADERVDGGLWPKDGRLYRVTKSLEKRFFKAADYVVTLTHASKEIILDFDYLKNAVPPISVIPTCADLERFNLPKNKAKKPFIFGYVGSIGTWYLFDETMAFFKEVLKQEPSARFLIINRHEHEYIRSLADKHGVDQSLIEIKGVEHSQVPVEIAKMHAAAALIKPCYSKMASAPTKLAEYLGCGVPCLGNAGVGDMEDILQNRKTGIVLNGFGEKDLSSAAKEMIKLSRKSATAKQCRDVALELFSLEAGVLEYQRIYKNLAANTA